MTPLKEAIQELHTKAEQMPFNQRMFRGELSHTEYALYLCQLLNIFSALEKHPLPHPSLARTAAIEQDLYSLTPDYTPHIIESTQHYRVYLLGQTQEALLPHVYLHYLAIMFGGNIMKSRVPGTSNVYTFNDQPDALHSIRILQQDSWAPEAIVGLTYFIEILDELYDITRPYRVKI